MGDLGSFDGRSVRGRDQIEKRDDLGRPERLWSTACEHRRSQFGGHDMQQLPHRGYSRDEMMTRVARFDELKGSDGGLPDSKYPSAERTLYNVIGFQPPENESDAITSPVGEDAARNAAIPIREGFNLGYCRAKPGKGPMMHNHDTNETFIAISGRWRASWEDDTGGVEHVDLDPLDLISIPAGAIRRFENVTEGEPDVEHVLMFVIGGDEPQAEFTDDAMDELRAAGVWPVAE